MTSTKDQDQSEIILMMKFKEGNERKSSSVSAFIVIVIDIF